MSMFVVGYFAAVLIGISLGLIGGGGSILTVPVLVYLFGIDAVLASTYSLFVVGATSLVGSVTYFRKGLVVLPKALLFGLPSTLAVFATRFYVLPLIPNEVLQVGSFVLTKQLLMLLLFAVLMVVAATSMIGGQKNGVEGKHKHTSSGLVAMVLQGLAVGCLTGFVGAGGGFLIIPALVGLLQMPMKKAIGTSLVIIALNAIVGFLFSMHHQTIDWSFLGTITGIAVVGILIGSVLSNNIEGQQLKPAFGWFVLVMGIYILIKETCFN